MRKLESNSTVLTQPLSVRDVVYLDLPRGAGKLNSTHSAQELFLPGCGPWRPEQHALDLSVGPNEDLLP